MGGTLSGNRSAIIRTITSSFWRAAILICLAQPYAYSQCDLSAVEWLDQLGGIEGSELAPEQKIESLSALKVAYEKCGLAKDSVYGQIVHRLGDFYRIAGHFEPAITLACEAVRVNKQKLPGAQPSYLTHSYYNLGLYHNLMGMSGEAHLYYDSCLAIGYQFAQKTFIVLMALERKSFLYFQSGDYEQSIRIADQGITLSRRKEQLPGYEALLLIQKAQSQAEINHIAQADRNISAAIHLLNTNELASYLPNAYSVYANVLSQKNQYEEAVSYYKKAMELNLAQNNKEQAARDLHDLGFLYERGLKDFKKSMLYYEKALSVLATLKDPYMLSATYNNLGQVCRRNGDFRRAVEYYHKGLMALPITYSNNDVTDNPQLEKLKTVANEYIAAALLWNKGDAWLALYDRETDVKYLEHALAAYHYGDRMVDQMRWKQQGEQSKLFWREKTKGWYGMAIEASFLLRDASEAFYFMEKSRAVLLNDKLAELGANHQLPRKEAEMERHLRIKLQSLVAAARSESGPSSADAIWRAQRELNSFINKLETRYPAYYSYKYDTTVCTTTDVREKLLSEDRAWLEFFTSGEIIYAIKITRDTAILKKIHFAGHLDVAMQITGLCSSMSNINRNFKQYSQLASLYYEKVFKDLEIKERRITISHDEQFLPFDLLQSDSLDQTSFLVRDHAFSYAYSATHILRSKPGRRQATASLLAVAPVHYAKRLQMQALSGADQSSEKIRSSYTDGVLLSGQGATKESFLAHMPAFDIIQVYSHAKADSIGQEPAIYFHDSTLKLSELQNLAGLKTQLIVLLACNSGVGRSVKGEGIFSLARGFAAAGIPSTISALWEIDNKATYTMAELFFEKLAQGEPSDIALQKAKLAMIDSHVKQYELPYYWASAVLIGKAELYSPENTNTLAPGKIALWLAGIATLAILIFLGQRRFISRASGPA